MEIWLQMCCDCTHWAGLGGKTIQGELSSSLFHTKRNFWIRNSTYSIIYYSLCQQSPFLSHLGLAYYVLIYLTHSEIVKFYIKALCINPLAGSSL